MHFSEHSRDFSRHFMKVETGKLKIITNNPLVHAEYADKTEFEDTDVSGVLHKVQNYIHLGAELMSSNIADDHSSGENPYRSFVLSELKEHVGMTTDFYSLTLIEDAIKELGDSPGDSYDDAALIAFQKADLDLLKNRLSKLN